MMGRVLVVLFGVVLNCCLVAALYDCNVTDVRLTSSETIQQFLGTLQYNMNLPSKTIASLGDDVLSVTNFVLDQLSDNADVANGGLRKLNQCPAFLGFLDNSITIFLNTTLEDTTICPFLPINLHYEPVPQFTNDPCCDWKTHTKAICSARNVTYEHSQIANWNYADEVGLCGNRTDELKSLYQYWYRFNISSANALSDMMFKRIEPMAALKQAAACFDVVYRGLQICSSPSDDSECYSGKCNYATSTCTVPPLDANTVDFSLLKCLKKNVPTNVLDAMYLELGLTPTLDSETTFVKSLFQNISKSACMNGDDTVNNLYTSQSSCTSAAVSYCNDYTSAPCSNPNTPFCGVCNKNLLCNSTIAIQDVTSCNVSGICYRGHIGDNYNPTISLASNCAGQFCNAPLTKLFPGIPFPCSSSFGICVPFEAFDNCIRAYSVLDDGSLYCDPAKSLVETPLGCISIIPPNSSPPCETSQGDVLLPSPILNSATCDSASSRCNIRNVFYPYSATLCAQKGGQMVPVFRFRTLQTVPALFLQTAQVQQRSVIGTLKWRRVVNSSMYQSFLARAISKAIFYPLYSSYIDSVFSSMNDLAVRIACTCEISSFYNNCSIPTQYTRDNTVATSVTGILGTAVVVESKIRELSSGNISPIELSIQNSRIILTENTTISAETRTETAPINTKPLYPNNVPITVVTENLNPEGWSGVTFTQNKYYVTDGKGGVMGLVSGAGIRIASQTILQNVVICGGLSSSSSSQFHIPVFARQILSSSGGVMDFRVASEVKNVYRDSSRNQICGVLSRVSSEMFFPSFINPVVPSPSVISVSNSNFFISILCVAFAGAFILV